MRQGDPGRLIAAAVAVLCALDARRAGADTICVPEDAPDIQAAIDLAGDGDTVCVGAGTWSGDGNLNLDFGGRLITLRGADPPEVTTIDCAGTGRALHFHSGENTNAVVRRLTIRNGLVDEDRGGAILCEESSPTIEDCVFIDNVATGTVEFGGWGGAIHCQTGSPVITGCTFSGNAVSGIGINTAQGGAVSCLDGSHPTITGCTFTSNTASGAGGAEGTGSGVGGALNCKTQSSPVVTDCVFTGNIANAVAGDAETGFGGAVGLSFGTDATFTNCTFDDNAAISAGTEGGIGGAAFIISASPVFEGCSFSRNSASIAGGGMWVQQSGSPIRGCTFTENDAQSGGAIAVFAFGFPTIEGCGFFQNRVTSADSFQQKIGGGAIASVLSSGPKILECLFVENTTETSAGGAISNTAGSDASIASCTFRGNRAALGGGALHNAPLDSPLDAAATATVVNSVFTGNGSDVLGGGILNDRSTLVVTSCTLTLNEASVAGAGLASAGFAAASQVHNTIVYGNDAPEGPDVYDAGTFTFATYSIIGGGWPGPGNLGVDPGFESTRDYQLGPDSPAIDAGDNDALPPDACDLDGDGDTLEPVPLDIGGALRRADDHCVADTGHGATPVVDMGAYERQPDVDACDCNGNGVPDAEDIENGTLSDFNGNGIPDECESAFPGIATWMNPAGGLFRFSSNWDPGAPGPANPALFNLDAGYVVTLDRDAQTSRLLVRGADVTFDADPGGVPYAYLVTSVDDASIVIGELPGDDAMLTVAGGGLGAVGDVQVGRDSGAAGMLQVTGAGGSFTTEQNLCVGCFGTGGLRIDGGAFALCRDADIGAQPNSFGEVVVTGAGSSWEVPFFITIDRGRLVVEDGASVVAGIDPFSGIFLFGEGEIAGDGLIDSTVVNFGTVRPAPGVGPLTIDRDYYQSGQVPGLGAASGTLTVEVGGSVPGLEHGQLLVNGDAFLAGGLFVELVDDFEPAVDDTFQLVDALGVETPFDVAYLPALSGDLFMRVTYGTGVAAGVVTVGVETLADLLAFGDPTGTIVPGQPTNATIGPLDGDAFPDLAITVAGDTPGAAGSVLVLINDGTGTAFAVTQQITVGVDPVSITIGRLDGDDVLDLAVANRGSDTVSVLFNGGDGVFGPPSEIAVGGEPVAVAAARFAPAGPITEDLAVSSFGDGTIEVFQNDGGGIFTPAVARVLDEPGPIDPNDLDDDKDFDIVATSVGGDTVVVFENTSSGSEITLGETLVIPVGRQPVALVRRGAGGSADLDGNGLTDLVTANLGDGTISVVLNQGGAGVLDFAPAVNLPVGDEPVSIAALDLEQDGDVDLAVVAKNDLGVPALRSIRNDTNDGEQLAFAQPVDLDAGAGPLLVLSGDLNQDADEDLLTINADVVAVAGSGPAAATATVLPNLANALDVPGDVNGDGVVNVLDLTLVIIHWGTCPAPCPADLTGDSEVNVNDLNLVVVNWS